MATTPAKAKPPRATAHGNKNAISKSKIIKRMATR